MFFDTFRALCFEKGVSHASVMRDLGLGRNTPLRWKNGSTPDMSTAQKIASYFGVTIDYLLNGDEKISNVANGNIRGYFVFYDRVAELCLNRKIKLTTMARKLGLSPSSPARWKAGSLPRADALQKIADYFGVTTDYLLNGDEKISNVANGNITGSSVIIGSRAQTITSNVGSSAQSPSAEIDGFTREEMELLRIFRSLDMRGQNAVLHFSYEQLDRNSEK